MQMRELANHLIRVNMYSLTTHDGVTSALIALFLMFRNAGVILRACDAYKDTDEEIGEVVNRIRQKAMNVRVFAVRAIGELLWSVVTHSAFRYTACTVDSYKQLTVQVTMWFDYLEPDLSDAIKAAL